ncbi:MAG: transcription antitermination factor NusB [Gammaproteobacteria bacterium]|jgi:N utilization substance protein B|nr:transcription antitermination factor NusB [Gammaproteobacteria bacterium]
MGNARTPARRLAVQALYQWQLAGQDIGDIIAQFCDEQQPGEAQREYFSELLRGVLKGLDEIDDLIAPLLDRPMTQVDPVERAILRVGAFELAHRPEVPYRVVINEGVELAKRFGAEQGHRFVNGVLDRLAHQLRAVEQKASGGPA